MKKCVMASYECQRKRTRFWRLVDRERKRRERRMAMGISERANPRERAVGVSRTKGVEGGVVVAIVDVQNSSIF